MDVRAPHMTQLIQYSVYLAKIQFAREKFYYFFSKYKVTVDVIVCCPG